MEQSCTPWWPSVVRLGVWPGGPRCRRPLAPSPARHEDLGDACTSGPEHLVIDAVSPPADAQLSDSDVDRAPQLTGQIGGGQASRPAREDHDRYQAPAPEKQKEDNEGGSATLEPGAFCTMALHPCRPVRRPRRCGEAVEDHLIDHNGVPVTHGALQDRDLARELGEGRPSCPNPPKLGPPECPTRPEASRAQGVRVSRPERCLATASAIWLMRNR